MTSTLHSPSKSEQKERTHATILESAAHLLRTQGIAGARVLDIMRGAGLTVGGFYAHFTSKRALVDETLRQTGAYMRAKLLARITEKPPADRAEVVLKRYLSAAHRDDNDIGCPLPAVAGEVATTAPEHTPVLAEQLGLLTDEIETLLPPVTLSRRQLSLGLLSLMYGGLTLARAVRGTELSDELLRACRAVGRSILHGGPSSLSSPLSTLSKLEK